MKPYEIFKKRKIRNKDIQKIWDRIRYKHCVVMVYNNKGKHTIVKNGEDKYLLIAKNLGSDEIKIYEQIEGFRIVNDLIKVPIKYHDKKLFKEYEEYLVCEAI